MPEVTDVTLELGVDRYSRRVQACRTKDGGQWFWTLRTLPSSQRDDGEIMRSLTDENVRELARCLEVLAKPIR